MLKRLLGSSALLVGQSAANKFIGMLSTLVLARMLLPEDFGLIALAMLVIGLLDIFTQTRAGQYILRADSVDDDLLNSAWTLNLCLKIALAVVLAGLSPLISDAYSEPQLEAILWVFAALLVFQTCRNPGTLLLQRDQRFERIVSLGIIAKVVSAIVAVTLALLGAAHWALIAGRVTLALVDVAGSYVIHPYRPRLCTTRIREQFRFSGWLILQSVGGYSRNNLDTFLVSTSFGNAQLGSFQTMKYLAFIPSSQILLPATQPLLRELSKHRENPDYFALQHNVSFLAGACLALPIASLMAAMAHDLVAVFLGSNWTPYSDLFRWFSLLIPTYLVFQHATRTCIIFGRTKLTFQYEIFALFFVFLPLLLTGIADILAFTSLRVELEIASTLIFLGFTTLHFTNLKTLLALALGVIPIIIACVIATAGSFACVSAEVPLVRLIYFSAVWAVIFGATFLALILGPWRHQREWAYLITKGEDAVAFAVRALRAKFAKP